MRRALPIALMILALAAARAEAVTVKDIIDLTKAGLGEEVLLALIEVDGGVFTINTATLTALKKAGVSERVIEAMVRSGRMGPPEPPVVVSAEAISKYASVKLSSPRKCSSSGRLAISGMSVHVSATRSTPSRIFSSRLR